LNRFATLALKLSALFSACGGPMVVMDALKPTLGDPLHFVVGFAPVALAVMGAFSLALDEHDAPARFFVAAGLAGVVAVAATNVYAVVRLVRGPPPADAGLVVLGIVVGTLSGIGYVARYRTWRA
jgi:hypothetical protein